MPICFYEIAFASAFFINSKARPLIKLGFIAQAHIQKFYYSLVPFNILNMLFYYLNLVYCTKPEKKCGI